MFDKYQIGRTVTEHIPYEKNVTINRAPTDESIKLYEEFKKKAYDSILDSISINNNTINLSAVLYRDPSSYKKTIQYKMIVNGREMRGEVELKQELNQWNRLKWVQQLWEDFSKKLAENLSANLFFDAVNGITEIIK